MDFLNVLIGADLSNLQRDFDYQQNLAATYHQRCNQNSIKAIDAIAQTYSKNIANSMTDHSTAYERKLRAIAIAAEVRAHRPEMQVKRITAPKEEV